MSILPSYENYLDRLFRTSVQGCAKCHGSGASCACRDAYEFEVKKALAHIPRSHSNFTMDILTSPDVQRAKKEVIAYIKEIKRKFEEGIGLFLWSKGTGTGKTSLGVITLIEALRQHYSVYYTTLEECVQLTTEGWYDHNKVVEFEQKMLNVDFLLIDDIGGREIKSSGNSLLINSRFTSLLKQRNDALLPTIITSNFSLNDIREIYGERIYSVMCECVELVNCTGLDYRKEVIGKAQNPGKIK